MISMATTIWMLSFRMPFAFPAMGSGLIFLPGKGNGTFGSPVLFSQQNSSVIQGFWLAI